MQTARVRERASDNAHSEIRTHISIRVYTHIHTHTYVCICIRQNMYMYMYYKYIFIYIYKLYEEIIHNISAYASDKYADTKLQMSFYNQDVHL